VGDGRAPRHDVGVETVVRIARKLEQAGRPPDQSIEPLAGGVVGEARAIDLAGEGQDRLQLPAQLERKLRRDLVGAVGDRRHEAQPRRLRREAVALPFQQFVSGL